MKTGLILVDIQNDYFPGGPMELFGIQEAVTKAQELLSIFRDNRQPTFHIQHISRQESATFFRPDTPGVEIHDHIKPFPDDRVIQKGYPNSFRETRLLEELNKDRITQLVICGAMSHMCIDATTRPPLISDFIAKSFRMPVPQRTLYSAAKPSQQNTFMGRLWLHWGSICSGFGLRRI